MVITSREQKNTDLSYAGRQRALDDALKHATDCVSTRSNSHAWPR